jgi:hypothetical protein
MYACKSCASYRNLAVIHRETGKVASVRSLSNHLCRFGIWCFERSALTEQEEEEEEEDEVGALWSK